MDIETHGKSLKGGYELTAQGTNHVDDGDLDDWKILKSVDESTFLVSFHFSGTLGVARLRIKGRKLYWHTLSEQPKHDEDGSWRFSPGENAVLFHGKPKHSN